MGWFGGGVGQIKSVDGFVFFRLYFGYSDLQLFAIFIFEVVFSETYLVTSAENNVLDPPNLKKFFFWGGGGTTRRPYKARAFGTCDNGPPVTKDLPMALK